MTTMTIDELLAEVQASYKGDEGLTTREWADKMNCSELTMRKRIKLLLRADKMRHGKAPRTSEMDGRTLAVSVYRLI